MNFIPLKTRTRAALCILGCMVACTSSKPSGQDSGSCGPALSEDAKDSEETPNATPELSEKTDSPTSDESESMDDSTGPKFLGDPEGQAPGCDEVPNEDALKGGKIRWWKEVGAVNGTEYSPIKSVVVTTEDKLVIKTWEARPEAEPFVTFHAFNTEGELLWSRDLPAGTQPQAVIKAGDGSVLYAGGLDIKPKLNGNSQVEHVRVLMNGDIVTTSIILGCEAVTDRFTQSLWISRFSSSGTFKWARPFFHPTAIEEDVQVSLSIGGIDEDRNGNIYLGGHIQFITSQKREIFIASLEP